MDADNPPKVQFCMTLTCSLCYPTVKFTSSMNKVLRASKFSPLLSVYTFTAEEWLGWRNGCTDDSRDQVKDLFLPLCFSIPQPSMVLPPQRSLGCSPRSGKLVCFVVATNLPFFFFFWKPSSRLLPFLSTSKKISWQKKLVLESRRLHNEDIKFNITSIYENGGRRE